MKSNDEDSEFIHKIFEKGMKVPAYVFASQNLFESMKKDKTLEQLKNMASLPGVVGEVYAMPDAHQGYGFPIGGVVAFDIDKGIVSPGGVGYDINCGVRMLITNLSKSDFIKKRKEFMKELGKSIPSGVGTKSSFSIKQKEIDEVLENGVRWAVERGFAERSDMEKIESGGNISGANSKDVSQRAKGRGMNQLGSLGAGNHFVEIQFVEKIFDKEIAKILGIKNEEQIAVLIHSGSRGLGHQVASDYIKEMEEKYGYKHLPDRELACAPINSELGKKYLSAMACAANFGFVNRQILSNRITDVFSKYFPNKEVNLIYDLAHNIAKIEEHKIDGKKRKVCVHRKGATRSFGPGNKEIPKIYQKIGQPIFIPGSMGTYSYVLVGTKEAEKTTLGSTAHGAGRILSRSSAVKTINAKKMINGLEKENILLETTSIKGAVEEAPEAYKDVVEVVRVSHELGIGKIVAKMKPLGVVKG
jgi:tRNA-splicing ligase RtcB